MRDLIQTTSYHHPKDDVKVRMLEAVDERVDAGISHEENAGIDVRDALHRDGERDRVGQDAQEEGTNHVEQVLGDLDLAFVAGLSGLRFQGAVVAFLGYFDGGAVNELTSGGSVAGLGVVVGVEDLKTTVVTPDMDVDHRVANDDGDEGDQERESDDVVVDVDKFMVIIPKAHLVCL